ncbi:MAG: PRC-barrel domain-containing protein [Chloroflexia bacterium]|nr:PRC-barrel domain-containing protein [Chloroflexia bacterium]
MKIDFGQEVQASDGETVGSVVGLVVNGATFEVTRVLVGHGRGEPPRLVDVSAVRISDGDRITLDLSRASFEATGMVESRETATEPRVPEFPTIIPTGGVGGPVLTDASDTGPGYPGGDLFDIAPIDPPVVQVESNLLFSEAVLHRGSDVVSSDGHKVGTLDEATVGELGIVEALVVRAGFLFHHDLRIPVVEVADFGTNRIHLKITKDAAEALRG